MLLVSSDGTLSTSHEPLKAINGVKSALKLKGDKAAFPEARLEAGTSEVKNYNGTKCRTMSSEKHVKSAIANVEEKLAGS